MQRVTEFINSKQFWIYHGFVLSALWVLASAFGIFIKKFNKTLHALNFAIVDFTTLFFAGAAAYRVFSHIDTIGTWSVLKIGHVFGGSLFLVLVILQHLGGVKALLSGQRNYQHASFGRTLALIGRIVAGFGWVLAGNIQNAIIVAVLTIILLIFSGLGKSSGNKTDDSRIRSKSPRGKRQ